MLGHPGVAVAVASARPAKLGAVQTARGEEIRRRRKGVRKEKGNMVHEGFHVETWVSGSYSCCQKFGKNSRGHPWSLGILAKGRKYLLAENRVCDIGLR